ncbi:MAG: hypothetical protein V4438_01380 [Patescibacteria group bacterium]
MKKIYIYILVIAAAIILGAIIFANKAKAPAKEAENSIPTLGDIAFVYPEANPQDAKPLPEKGYIESRVFNNYKAPTSVIYIPVSSSTPWASIGYNATLYVADTKESCRGSGKGGQSYTGAHGTPFTIYDIGSQSLGYYYETKIYQADINQNCYNIGIYEEVKIDENLKTKQIKEAVRLRTILQKLADSVYEKQK